MELALFDLDNTLLAGDSDYLWGRYLVEHGLVDGAEYEAQNQKFYQDYKAGQLDIRAFARFSLGRMGQFEPKELDTLRSDYVANCIKPIVAAGTQALLHEHREAGRELVIITATNSYITSPIAELLGIDTLLGTDGVRVDGRFNGEIEGIPCFQQGKIEKLQQWLSDKPRVSQSWFYSDSINDAPLLEWADHAFAVDPCERLSALASEKNWPILSLRN
ncbi:MAG: HAD family hydrolase [Oceanococcus sp.]